MIRSMQSEINHHKLYGYNLRGGFRADLGKALTTTLIRKIRAVCFVFSGAPHLCREHLIKC